MTMWLLCWSYLGCCHPLIVASKQGRTERVAMLLEMGADVEAKDWWGETALYFASCHGHDGHTETVRLLKQYGAKEYHYC